MAFNLMNTKARSKHYKLIVHPRTFGTADLILNSKDFPHLKLHDIVEIYHPEEEYSRLLLQVTIFKEDLQARDTISVEQNVAATFQLRTYSNVCVNKIDPATVSLGSVEFIFRDQYIGRSEMWRLKKALVNTCVYLNKKIEFCGGTGRVHVYEMWTQGERVACGVVMEDTKLIFRSSTSMVYLFIQMSSEMWDFDIHGDLYFEKAVDGFLTELFQKWKKHGSNHEVTVVLFSRAFYKATNLEEFPEYMQECLQKDYKGFFYEDFYRVVVQNERYDDWSKTLLLLKRLFTDYKKMILDYHKKPNYRVPPVYLSTAARGNFLEVLNISLNVFEKHYLERSLDRTGQLIVVVSPGVGVFEVDRELANVIKQRIIDNGVGSDLVCVGEQPLHAVPLFKFHNKDSSISRDDYSMPHWINLSFYSSGKKLAYSKFVPRIKLPPRRSKPSNQNVITVVPKPKLPTDVLVDDSSFSNQISAADIDYDSYDADVFTLPPTHSASVQKAFGRVKKTSFNHGSKTIKWKMSDPDIYRSQLFTAGSAPPITRSTSIAIASPQSHSYSSNSFLAHLDLEKPRGGEFCMEDDLSPSSSNTVTSSVSSSTASTLYMLQNNSIQSNSTAASSVGFGSPSVCPGRALINPFDPSYLTIKLTSNRRRWTHVFPKGPTGVVVQQHHYHLSPTDNEADKKSEICESELGSRFSDDSPLARSPSSVDSKSRTCIRSYTLFGSPENNLHKKTQALLWGVTGEQEWTPALTTGVDWKSLTIPACLPITTDYFPDEVCLKTDYVFSDHNLLPDDLNADYAQKRAIYRKPLSTNEVFLELISQRLAQGFQIVVNSESGTSSSGGGSVIAAKSSLNVHPVMEFKLSIGRIFHKVSLYGSEIRVTCYRPRHPYPPFVIDYRYRFQAPDHSTYGISWVSFNAEKLENYNWNYLDHYICTRGDTDFALTESCKYWRFRMYAVPGVQPATRRLLEGYPYCNIYSPLQPEEHTSLKEGFLKFIESPINRIRRMIKQPPVSRDLPLSSSQINRRRHSTGIVFLAPPQEKNILSNHRLVAKNNSSGSGSKVLEKSRIFPTNDTMVPLAINLDADHTESSNVLEVLCSNANISNVDIVEVMLHPQLGIEFLSKYPSLPTNTFVSYDAVRWIIDKVGEINLEKHAVDKLEDMRNDGLICHASGDRNHPFILGYYLYFIVQSNKIASSFTKEKMERIDPICDLDTFENEWVEIKLKHLPPKKTSTPKFLFKNLDEDDCGYLNNNGWTVPFYKQANLEVDINSKSDRIEWSHIKYQSEYRVDRAFEFSIQWVAASGPMVSDLIFNLVRKAQIFKLQLIPVPSDPHALPYSLKSDPLRGPVFVPLDIEGIMENKSYLFEEYPEESWARRLILFQESIAMNFGFIACATDREFPHHNQYVHVTGNVFLLIVSPLCEYTSEPEIQTLYVKPSSLRTKSTRIRTIKDENEIAVSPHQEYISRHVTSAHNVDSKKDNRIGFLWSWNHMVGRRWKSSNLATGDEPFQDKLLKDFRQFCSNSHNRLKVYWDSCLAL